MLQAPPEDMVEEWAKARFLALTEESQVELILEYCDSMSKDTRRKVISQLMVQQFRDINYPQYKLKRVVEKSSRMFKKPKVEPETPQPEEYRLKKE